MDVLDENPPQRLSLQMEAREEIFTKNFEILQISVRIAIAWPILQSSTLQLGPYVPYPIGSKYNRLGGR